MADLFASCFPEVDVSLIDAATPKRMSTFAATPPTENRFAGVADEAAGVMREIRSATHLNGIAIRKRGLDEDAEEPTSKVLCVDQNVSGSKASCNICHMTDGHWMDECPIGLAYTDAKGDKTAPCRQCGIVPVKGARIIKMKAGRFANRWIHARCAAEQGVLLGLMPPMAFAKIWGNINKNISKMIKSFEAKTLEEVMVAAHEIVSDDVSPTLMYQDNAACILVVAKAVKEKIGAAECRKETSMGELFKEIDRIFPESTIHAKVRARHSHRARQWRAPASHNHRFLHHSESSSSPTPTRSRGTPSTRRSSQSRRSCGCRV